MAQADVSTPGNSPIPCNLVLIGFMGTGKSTVSDYFHTQYNMDIIEMDQIIAQREGMSITEIFNRYGEEYFRDLETALLVEMQSHKDVVLSCGGGVPMRERNVKEMKKIGRVILLTADPETILKRLKEDHSRPLQEHRLRAGSHGQPTGQIRSGFRYHHPNGRQNRGGNWKRDLGKSSGYEYLILQRLTIAAAVVNLLYCAG